VNEISPAVKIERKNEDYTTKPVPLDMNNPRPFRPQGRLLGQKYDRHARAKIAVLAVLAIHGSGLLDLLMQGCRTPVRVEATNVINTSL